VILIDTGPLVALFDPKDPDFKHCHLVLKGISEPLYTTEAVLTEVLHLLDPASQGSEGVKKFVLERYVALLPLDIADIERAFELMDQYLDRPMDLTDATLLVLAEKLRTRKVFTLDENDFSVYRVKRGHRHYPVHIIGRD
jgi:hypothetical protein